MRKDIGRSRCLQCASTVFPAGPNQDGITDDGVLSFVRSSLLFLFLKKTQRSLYALVKLVFDLFFIKASEKMFSL